MLCEGGAPFQQFQPRQDYRADQGYQGHNQGYSANGFGNPGNVPFQKRGGGGGNQGFPRGGGNRSAGGGLYAKLSENIQVYLLNKVFRRLTFRNKAHSASADLCVNLDSGLWILCLPVCLLLYLGGLELWTIYQIWIKLELGVDLG